MEKLKKEKFDARKELFVAMINKLNDVQIKHVANLLEVNPQACLEYLHHYEEDLDNKTKENPVNIEEREWWEDFEKTIQHDATTGFCRIVNTTNPSFATLTFDELLGVMNMEKLTQEERNKIKPKLIRLLAQYLYKPINIILPENKTRVLVKKIPNLTITNEKANTPQIRTFLQGQSST